MHPGLVNQFDIIITWSIEDVELRHPCWNVTALPQCEFLKNIGGLHGVGCNMAVGCTTLSQTTGRIIHKRNVTIYVCSNSQLISYIIEMWHLR